MRQTLVAVFLVFFALSANAGGLGSPFSLDSTAVLPQGVRNVRITTFTIEATEKFSASGSAAGLGAKFNRPVTWKDLISAQPSGFERDSLKGYVQSEGAAMADAVGESYGEVNARVTGTVPTLAYGLSEKVTLALAVPVVYTNVSVDVGWAANPRFQKFLDEQGAKGKNPKLAGQEAKLHNVVQTKLATLNYQELRGESRREVGDLVVGLKYLAHKSDSFAWSLAPRLVLPTGRVSDINKVVDLAPGDGQFDLGISSVTEAYLGANSTLYLGAGYLAQLPSQKAKRLPESRDESLSIDIDRSVAEDLGDIFSVSIGGKYKLLSTLTMGAQLTGQYKQQDSYFGSTYAPERYGFLSADTEASLNTAQVGLAYSTIPLFQAGRFPIPLDVSVGYTWALSGKNANVANLAALELAAYF